MPSSALTCLTAHSIFTGEAFEDSRALLIKDGKVVDIVRTDGIPAETPVTSLGDCIIAPGFIDCQVNGGDNVLFNAVRHATDVVRIAKAHARKGTTRLMLTCTSDSPETAATVLNLARQARRACPAILGVHFEGPHLNPDRKGVHASAWLRGFTDADLPLYQPEADEIILVTVAPERVPAEQIRQLTAQGTIVSLGHTAANPAIIRGALKAGARGFTHLFNAMGPLSAREPGPAGIALDDRDSWCSLIADGHHISDEMIRLALRAKPPGKLYLVSDAMPPAAANHPEPFQLYGGTVAAQNGRCQTKQGALAGSAATLAECVSYAITAAGVDPAEALRMASAYPAAFLGIENRYGKLLPGYCADIVSLTCEWTLQMVSDQSQNV